MTRRNITYKGGYKYQLKADYKIEALIKPVQAYNDPSHFMNLYSDGSLIAINGCASDGPSGPVPDTN